MDDLVGGATPLRADLGPLAIRLGLNVVVAFVVIHLVYNRIYRRRDYVFTYTLFNLITFALCSLLDRVPVELGFALGLFAVFGILRYRTESIRLKDLTYLFVVIGVGIMNAVGTGHIRILELVLVNSAIALAVILLEGPFRRDRLEEQAMTYDKLELLRPENHAALLRNLEERTGLRARRVVVEHVDLVRESAKITVHYARD